MIWALVTRVFGLMPLKDWLIAAALAFIVGYHVYAVHEARVAGRDEGRSSAQAQCAAEKKAAKADYDRRVKEEEDKSREVEQAQATELAVTEANYQKEIQDAQDQRQRDVAAAQSGAIKLRVAGMCPRASGDRPAAQTSTAPAERDGAASGELPGPLTASLFAIADDADAVVHQLTACQTVVRTYLGETQ